MPSKVAVVDAPLPAGTGVHECSNGAGENKEEPGDDSMKERPGDVSPLNVSLPLSLPLQAPNLSANETTLYINSAIQLFPPGTQSRLDKIISYLQHGKSTVKGVKGIPLRLTHYDLLASRMAVYRSEQVSISDGISHMRKYLSLMYDKHTLERGMKVSTLYRREHQLRDPSLAYGEIEVEIFVTLYSKLSKAFGVKPGGVFYDLGCGVGNLVYAAAFVGDFSRCGGIEIIPPLLERGLKRMARWKKYSAEKDTGEASMVFTWDCSDFTKFEGSSSSGIHWTEDASFILLHWTAFSVIQRRALEVDMLTRLQEGAIVVTLTHPIDCKNRTNEDAEDDFLLLVADELTTSWGLTSLFVYEKVSPRVMSGKFIDSDDRSSNS